MKIPNLYMMLRYLQGFGTTSQGHNITRLMTLIGLVMFVTFIRVLILHNWFQEINDCSLL